MKPKTLPWITWMHKLIFKTLNIFKYMVASPPIRLNGWHKKSSLKSIFILLMQFRKCNFLIFLEFRHSFGVGFDQRREVNELRVFVCVCRWFRWWLVWSVRCSRATARAPSTAEAFVCRSPFLTSKTTSSRISNSSTVSYRRIRVRTTGLCRPEPGFTWRRPCRRSDAQTARHPPIRRAFMEKYLKTFADADVRDGPWSSLMEISILNISGSKSSARVCVCEWDC